MEERVEPVGPGTTCSTSAPSRPRNSWPDYVPLDQPSIPSQRLGFDALQSAIEDLGYTFGRAEESLISRRPTLFERETLDLEPDECIVQILRTSYSTEGTPVHAMETICAASRHIFPIGQVAGTDEF